MRVVAWDAADEVATETCYGVTRAVRLADDPLGPPMSQRATRAMLMSAGEPAQTWFVPGDDGGCALGLCQLRLPRTENRDRAHLYFVVHPEHRRRGIGLALLRHAARQAAQDGRSVLSSGANQGSAGEEFARWLGAKPGHADARRVLDLG